MRPATSYELLPILDSAFDNLDVSIGRLAAIILADGECERIDHG